MEIYKFVKKYTTVHIKWMKFILYKLYLKDGKFCLNVALSRVFIYFTLKLRTASMCFPSMKPNCLNLFGNFLYIP